LALVSLPDELYAEATEVLIGEMLPVIGEVGQSVETATMLNSFDYHWRFMLRSITDAISAKAKKKMQDGISSAVGRIALDRGISPEQRLTAAALEEAVTAAMSAPDTDAEESIEEEEEEEDNPE
jgi:hypothetical protein